METTNQTIEKQVTLVMTERTDEILHLILDLKNDKDVDLYRLQTLVLGMYRDNIELVHTVSKLEKELDSKRRKVLEVPKFMVKREEAQ